jgi:hypothetical protein
MESDSATFTVRLINNVTAPARSVQQAMGGVDKIFKQVQSTMAAPAPRRSALSDWDKMAAKAKLSQAKDFAAQHAKVMKAHQQAQQQSPRGGFMSDLFGELAPAALSGGIAGAVAAGVTELASVGKQAAMAIFDLGKAFVDSSIEAGVFAEKSQLAIGFLTNNAPQAAEQFDQVRHMAQNLGLEVNETVGSFERLLAMQFSVGRSKDLIKMAADMQAIGANGEEVQRILYAISEIKSMGTLQKRQERMLQMAGISGTLIDSALMKHMGIQSHDALEKARKGNKIGSDVAVDAIMEAVMHKTHESNLGEAGAAFASKTMAGMTAAFHAKVDNMFTDVGALLMPGVTKMFGLFSDIFTAITTDPKILGVGQVLLETFNRFTDWVDQNWGAIVSTFVTGAEWLAAVVEFVVGMFDSSTMQGKITIGVLETLVGVFLALEIAGAALMLPLYAVIAIIGGIVYAIDWLAGKVKALGEWIAFGPDESATSAVDAAKLPQITDVNGYTTAGSGANDNNGVPSISAASGISALQGMASATESGSPVDSHAVDMSGMQIHVTSRDGESPEELAQRIHSEIAKIMRQSAA